MRKSRLFVSFAASLFLLASCSKGIEKEYEMEIKEIVVVQNEAGDTLHAAHCKRSMSLFNYYIVLSEYQAEEAKSKEKLIAKATDKESKYKYGKDEVTDHGYVFVRFPEGGSDAK